MDEWLEDLDKCKDMGWYFEIESEESGRLADDIRKVLACIEQLEAALREIAETPDHYTPHMVRTHARAALGEKKDG